MAASSTLIESLSRSVSGFKIRGYDAGRQTVRQSRETERKQQIFFTFSMSSLMMKCSSKLDKRGWRQTRKGDVIVDMMREHWFTECAFQVT